MNGEHHPKGLYVLFFTEMWERFSFYLMIGILPQYLADSQKGGMGWSDEKAAVVAGSYGALVYFTPFIGGLIADRLLGFRKTILIGGVLMMIGHLVLAWPTELALYLGLGFLILGNGAFKPNISTLLGNLYPPGSKLKDAGYNIFYMGINIGAFACNFVAAFVRNWFDKSPWHITSSWTMGGWHAAFGTAAFGMLLGLVIFALNYRMFHQADQRPLEQGDDPQESLLRLWLECLVPAVLFGAGGWFLAAHDLLPVKPPTAAFFCACLPVIVFYLRIWRSVPERGERGRVAALLVIFAVAVVFWTTFYLPTTALTVWTRDDTSREPNAVVRLLTDRVDEFAENAPPSYFANAGPDTPRPAPKTFDVISDKEYERLKEEHKLNVVQGERVYVTQKMFEDVYKHATPQTPQLEEDKQHKVVNAELYNSINAGYVILLTPLLVGFFHWLRNRGSEPSTPAKMGIGLLLTAAGTAIMLAATLATSNGTLKGSSWWLFGFYAVITTGELCLSPIGLSLVSKMAPARIRAFMMGGWFLSTSFGAKLSGIFGEAYHQMDHSKFWIILIVSNLVIAGVVFALLPWLNRQMKANPSPP